MILLFDVTPSYDFLMNRYQIKKLETPWLRTIEIMNFYRAFEEGKGLRDGFNRKKREVSQTEIIVTKRF